jgi:hypothetical protein
MVSKQTLFLMIEKYKIPHLAKTDQIIFIVYSFALERNSKNPILKLSKKTNKKIPIFRGFY